MCGSAVRDPLGKSWGASAPRRLPGVAGSGHPMDGVLRMLLDLLFVVLTLAFFAVAGLVLRGVERL
jgi:hypothetical protein